MATHRFPTPDFSAFPCYADLLDAFVGTAYQRDALHWIAADAERRGDRDTAMNAWAAGDGCEASLDELTAELNAPEPMGWPEDAFWRESDFAERAGLGQ